MKLLLAFFLICTPIIGGCQTENPIKTVECQYNQDTDKSLYQFDLKTGKSFEKDELSGKLIPLDGRTSNTKTYFDTRSFIVDDEWRYEMAISNKPGSPEHQGYMLKTILNLKTLSVTQTSYKEGDLGKWIYSKTYEGKCRWVKEKI
jgi:hypothetical protein